jgi:tetratricopeptide (TPR) repeat protein
MNKKIIIILLAIFISLPAQVFCASKEEERFFIAAKAFSDGFYEASLSLFKRFNEEFPASSRAVEAKLYIAKCYYFKQDYKQALDILSGLLNKEEAQKFLEEIYYWFAQVYYRGKDFANSYIFCQKIIEKYPSSQFIWEILYLAAIDCRELNKPEEAKKLLIKIIEENKDRNIAEEAYSQLFIYYFQEKNYPRLIEVAENCLRRRPKDLLAAKAYFYLGESFYAERNFNKALENYINALELNADAQLTDLILQGLAFARLEKEGFEEAKKNIDAIKDEETRLYSQGIYYVKIKNYEKALETFDALITHFPQGRFFSGAYLNKADTLYEMGRVNDSLSGYLYILNNFRSQQYVDILDKAHYGLAWCYLKNGEFKKAIEEFKNTLKYTDNSVVKISSQIQIADAYQEAGNYNQALDIYSEILKNNPNTIYDDYIQFQIGITFLRAKRLEEALLALRNLQKSFPSSKLIPQAQYYLAVSYFSAESYREAEDLLEDFIKKFTQSELLMRVYYLYGKCFYNEKKYDKALEVFRNIIGKFNDRQIEELVYIDIGNCYLNLSQFDNAKKIWEDFLHKFNKSQYAGSVALYLGGLYEKEADYLQAEKYYKNVLESYKDSPWAKEALLSLGHLYLSQKDIDKAQVYFENLINADSPLAFKAKMHLAKIYEQKGRKDDALKIYDELISLDSPISKLALLDKAYFLKENGVYPEAIALFKKALTAGIESPKLRFYLAMCLEKVNQNKEAIEEYFKVIYTFSSDTSVTAQEENANDYKVKSYFRIAKLYEKEKRNDAAKEIYKKITGLGTEESKIAAARLKELEGK